jgi:hypothetical protein
MIEQLKMFFDRLVTVVITMFFVVLFIFVVWWTGWIELDIKRPVRHAPMNHKQQAFTKKADVDGYSAEDRGYMQSILNNTPGGI